MSLEHLEREVIREALRRVEGNVTKAATLLKMSRDTLRYRIQKHDLSE
jgi:DNA-binding NtrC family response regulator